MMRRYFGVALTSILLLIGAAIPASAAGLMRVTFIRHGESYGKASGKQQACPGCVRPGDLAMEGRPRRLSAGRSTPRWAGVPRLNSLRRCGVLLPPDSQLAKHWGQVSARRGQYVIVARRMLAVATPFDEPRLLESAQPRGQAGPGGAGVDADVVELGHTKTELAQRKKCPLVPDERKRVGNRAHPRPDAVECIF
jgi:hypothetical protein